MPTSAAWTWRCGGAIDHAAASSSRRWRLSVYLFVIIPKGFFPQQDNGLITATSEAAQDISFADMKRHQEELGADRASRSRRRQHCDVHRRRRQRAQHRPHVYYAEAARTSATPARSRSSHGCGRKLEKVQGARLFMQAAQDVRLGGRADPHPVRIHAAGRQPRRTERVGAEDPGQDARRCRNCATSRPTSRPRAPR